MKECNMVIHWKDLTLWIHSYKISGMVIGILLLLYALLLHNLQIHSWFMIPNDMRKKRKVDRKRNKLHHIFISTTWQHFFLLSMLFMFQVWDASSHMKVLLLTQNFFFQYSNEGSTSFFRVLWRLLIYNIVYFDFFPWFPKKTTNNVQITMMKKYTVEIVETMKFSTNGEKMQIFGLWLAKKNSSRKYWKYIIQQICVQ